MKILLLLLLLCTFYFSFDAVYALSEVKCVIKVTSSIYPVYYNGDERNNPDNSFYPGDGFHYILEYSGDDTCISFSVNAIESGGAIDVLSHNIWSNSGFTQNHSHKSFEIIPNYFTIYNYYKILDSETEYHTFAGGGNNYHSTTYTLSESPVFSYREDDPNTQSISDKVSYYSKHSSEYQMTTTGEWGLLKSATEHIHENNAHDFEDDSSIIDFNNKVQSQCSQLVGKKGCVYGHAEIKPKAQDEICLIEELGKIGVSTIDVQEECIVNPNNLSLSVTGYKKVFETTDTGDVILKQVLVTNTASSTPNILSDEIEIIFENPPIVDIDGYDSKNLDSTYYVNDFPSIHVKPNIPFRDIRNNTLSFDVIRINNPLDEVSTDNCKNKSCLLNLANSYGNFTGIDGINGDRIDVFEPKSFDLGIHEIQYSVKLSNIDRQIKDADGTTEIFVVDYDPQFNDPYPFVDWDSIGKTSLEKLHSIGLHYMGSQGSGKNGDDSNLHELRRAKINDYYYTFYGQTLDVTRYINELANSNVTAVGEIQYYEDLMINFLHINITATPQGGSDVLSKKPYPAVSAVLDPSWDELVAGIFPSMKSKTNNTVVFEREGYGRLWVKFDNLASVVDRETLVNATVFGTPLSSNFGGHDITYLANYEYLFPHAPTNLWVNVTGIHSDGTQNKDLEISVMLSPYLENDDSNTIKEKDMFSKSQMRIFEEDAPSRTVYIPRYFQEHAKVLGTDDGNVAMQIADFHDIANSATYTGTQMVPMNKSIVYIPEMFWEMLEISDDKDFFRYSEYVSSNVPGLYVLQIDANGKTKKYPETQYSFNESITEIVNIDEDNKLGTLRFGDSINILPSEKFGNIVSININDTKLDRKCYNGCFFIVPYGRTASIDAYNIWGGIASAISAIPPPMTAEQEFSMLERTLDRYLPYMLISIVFFFSYTVIKRARRRK